MLRAAGIMVGMAAALAGCAPRAPEPVAEPAPVAIAAPVLQGGMPAADQGIAPRIGQTVAANSPMTATAPVPAQSPQTSVVRAAGCPPGVTGMYQGSLYCGPGG